MTDFVPLAIRTGVVYECASAMVLGVCDAGRVDWAGAFAFGVVTGGVVDLIRGDDAFALRAGMWFAVGDAGLRARGGAAIAIRVAERGVDTFGGPLEDHGRLRYIDGCTDTLLVAPPRLGAPCLNHLHIPAHTDQTLHTHASVRIGAIARGRGVCRGAREHALEPGMAWFIPANLRHAFRTTHASLDVVAWHPDSDVGPTDDDHPMINRTYSGPPSR